MISLSTLNAWLKIASVVALGILLLKLYWTGLFRIYRYFVAYVMVELVRGLVMSSMNSRTNLYAEVYFITQPLIWFFFIMVIMELFSLVLRNHKGIETLGRRALLGALVLSAVIAASTLVMNLQMDSPDYRFLNDFLVLERLIMSSLLLFVILLTAFLSYFPVTLNRNILVHASIFGFYFLARGTVLVFRNVLGPAVVNQLNPWANAGGLLCLLGWIILLTRSGEQRAAKAGARRSAGDEERVLAQLEAINSTLLRSARK
jgi:hypothetical protein